MQPHLLQSFDGGTSFGQLHVEIHAPQPGILIVTARGQVDAATVPVLRDALDRAVDARHPHVVVDLNAVTFMDAATLDLLVQTRQRAAAVGATIQVRCGTEFGQRVFKTLGLEDLLD